MRTLLSWIVLIVLLTREGPAQQQVGYVARIAERKGHFVDSTGRAELWRTRGQLRMPVRRADTLSSRDIVRLRERIFVDLAFRQPGLETNVYLGSAELSAVGSYEILQDTVGRVSGLQLVVKQGVMVVEHARGELMVVAGGIKTKILHTTVLFAVDSGDTTGTVFLKDGHISFPDFGMDATGTERVWRLRSGQRPEELFAPAEDLRPWQREVKYNAQSVWHARPFWQSPAFLVPAAAVVAGSVGCLATSCIGGTGEALVPPVPRSEGSVTVTIPE